jgi:UDP-N-acetyl-2-amino-2-deoxyglucuronate dehydrogenase
MSCVRIGIIGCGVIGQTHIEAATKSPLIDLVAVADMNGQAAKDIAAKFKVPVAYDNAEALLDNDKIDAVVLGVPTCARKELALRAFANGKHVLTEKPVAMNADDVELLLEAQGDLVGACCSSRPQFLDSTQAARKFLASGQLGDLRLLYCRALVEIKEPPQTPPPAWRLSRALNGGGILTNWGCYDLDYLLSITGWSIKPRTVFATSWPIPECYDSYVAPGSDAETHFAALVHCDNDIAISIERGEFMSTHREMAWQIIGTKGSLHLNMGVDDDKTIEFDEVTKTGIVATAVWHGKDDRQHLLEGPILDFAKAIQNQTAPATSLHRALTVQKITDAIYASSQQRIAVPITPSKVKETV